MGPEYRFQRQGRSWRVALVVLLVLALLVAGTVLIDATPWITVPIALMTLPAFWDLATNPSAGLALDSDLLVWHSARRRAEARLDEIEYVRFDTRWDLSVRATLYLKTDKRVRLPQECLPPHKTLERELLARDMPVKRHHFVVF